MPEAINLGCLCAQQRQRHDHPQHRVMAKANPLPDIETLRSLFVYDPITGSLRWLRNNKEAGNTYEMHNTKYRKVMIKQRNYYAHRIIYVLQTGVDPGNLCIDHADGNGLNNSWANLRIATHAQNLRNSRTPKNNTSGYKGVTSSRSGRWVAYIHLDRKKKYLGTFDAPELAHMAYAKAAAEMHGEFARAA